MKFSTAAYFVLMARRFDIGETDEQFNKGTVMRKIMFGCVAALICAAACQAQTTKASDEKQPQEPELLIDQEIRAHCDKTHEHIRQIKIDDAVAEQAKLLYILKKSENEKNRGGEFSARQIDAHQKELLLVQRLSVKMQQQYVNAYNLMYDSRSLIEDKRYTEALKLATNGLDKLRACYGDQLEKNNSLIQLYLEQTIGSGFLFTGNAKQATPHLLKASKISQKVYGNNEHPDHSKSMELLSRSLLDEQRFEEAEKQCRSILDQHRKTDLGISIFDARFVAMLAEASLRQKKYIEAEILCLYAIHLTERFCRVPQEAQEQLRIIHTEHPAAVHCRLLLAEIFLADGKLEHAEFHLKHIIQYQDTNQNNTYERIRYYKTQAKYLEKANKTEELKQWNLKLEVFQSQLTKQ